MVGLEKATGFAPVFSAMGGRTFDCLRPDSFELGVESLNLSPDSFASAVGLPQRCLGKSCGQESNLHF